MLAVALSPAPPSAPPPRRPGDGLQPYRSVRAQAWRNAMVSAVNAGLAAGVFGLEAGANFWRGAASEVASPERRGATYRFTAADGIPALAWVGDAGFDELSVHVALWPTPEAERWIACSNGGRLTGDLFAAGWLERRCRPYLQSSPDRLTGTRERIPQVAALSVAPRLGSYADRGRLLL